MKFLDFRFAVAEQFKKMSKFGLLRADINGRELSERYLAAFMPEDNPMFRARHVHDCNCCKSFIRTVGNVVAFDSEGNLMTIWDDDMGAGQYGYVSRSLASVVRRAGIQGAFTHHSATAGQMATFEGTGEAQIKWDHFSVSIPQQYVLTGTAASNYENVVKGNYDVLSRSLQEFTPQTIETVLELIRENNLYRGAEFKRQLEDFYTILKHQLQAGESPSETAWQTIGKAIQQGNPSTNPVFRIRNTSIGTLLIDIESGVPLDEAVRKFEAVVAPGNYKRPKPVVTKLMVDQAQKQIEAAGLENALYRQFAKPSDLPTEHVLFKSNNEVVNKSLFDGLAQNTPKDFGRASAMSMKEFIDNVLPTAKKVELFFDNQLKGNLFSLIGPQDPTAKELFKWPNLFSWAYSGDVADSVKERIKNAGGNVDGFISCRLGWNNHDDLDLWLIFPDGSHVNYSTSRRGGIALDVDMNNGFTRELVNDPVEHIVFDNEAAARPGRYKLRVYNYNLRDLKNNTYELSIHQKGKTFKHCDINPGYRNCSEFVFDIDSSHNVQCSSMSEDKVSQDVWGVKTNSFVEVDCFFKSPNYWSTEVGNLHYMFALKDCKNPGAVRGFFNEYLKNELNDFRKVFELLGSKTLVEPKENTPQVSGLGFSSTQRNSLVFQVTSATKRLVRVDI